MSSLVPDAEAAKKVTQNPLGDGVFQPGLVVELFHLLWTRTSSGHGCRGVLLPDTIIFEGGEPSVWYFTSTKVGEILRYVYDVGTTGC